MTGESVESTIFLLAAVYGTNTHMQLTLFPYLVTGFGLSDRQFGLLQTVNGVGQLIGGPLFGRFCDRAGIRRGLLLTYAWTAAVALSMCLAGGFGGLLLSRVLGVGMHGHQAHQTALTLATDGARRTNALSRVGVAYGIGFVVGPLMAGQLSKVVGNAWPLLLAAALCLADALFASRYLHIESTPPRSTAAEEPKTGLLSDAGDFLHLLRQPGVLRLFAVSQLAMAPLFLQLSVTQLFLIRELGVTPAQSSALSASVGVTMLLMSGVGNVWLRRRLHETNMLRLGIVVLTVGGLAVSAVSSFTHMLLLAPLLSAGMTLVGTVFSSTLTMLVPAAEHGAILGLSHALAAVNKVASPGLAVLCLEHFGFRFFGLLGAVSCSIALLILRRSPVVPVSAHQNI